MYRARATPSTHTHILTLILWRHIWPQKARCDCLSNLVEYVYYHSSVSWLKKLGRKVKRSVSAFICFDTPLSIPSCPLWPEKVEAAKDMPVQCEDI